MNISFNLGRDSCRQSIGIRWWYWLMALQRFLAYWTNLSQAVAVPNSEIGHCRQEISV